jgi:hypothetical protein
MHRHMWCASTDYPICVGNYLLSSAVAPHVVLSRSQPCVVGHAAPPWVVGRDRLSRAERRARAAARAKVPESRPGNVEHVVSGGPRRALLEERVEPGDGLSGEPRSNPLLLSHPQRNWKVGQRPAPFRRGCAGKAQHRRPAGLIRRARPAPRRASRKFEAWRASRGQPAPSPSARRARTGPEPRRSRML